MSNVNAISTCHEKLSKGRKGAISEYLMRIVGISMDSSPSPNLVIVEDGVMSSIIRALNPAFIAFLALSENGHSTNTKR
jgi:hypothetical protein